jgi:hypothetical protein
MPPVLASPVTDHAEAHRYEMAVEGRIAFASYRREPGRLLITHVETPPELQNRGVASRLMDGVADRARADGVKIVPLCGYAVAWMKRHPEHADLLAG